MPSNRHGGFGERSGETDREQSRHRAPGLLSDEAGQGLRPLKGRAWGDRGHTPVARVTAQGTKRVSMAALIRTKPGRRPRLIYRVHLDRGPAKGRRKGFTETDYARLLEAAHQQLGGPVVLVWSEHARQPPMRELIAARLWLTVYQLPPYAPELNPVEGVWSHLKRSLANLTTQPRPAHRLGEDAAEADAVPPPSHRGPHRQDRPRLPTAVTSAVKDL